MDLRTYLLAVRRGWLVIVLATLLGVLVGGAAYRLTPPTYASTVDFYVSTPGTEERNPQSSGQFAEARVNSYILLLSSERMAKEVLANAQVDLSPLEVASRIEASSELDTVLLKTTVTDRSAERSLRLAEGLAVAFPKLVDRLDNQGRRLDVVVVNVVSGPTPLARPVAPDLRLYLGLGLLAGLLLGLAAALLREVLNNSVRTAEMAQRLVHAPVLGTIGWDGDTKTSPLIVGEEAASLRAEAYRQLRTNLQFIGAAQSADIVMITSAVPLEGKSITAVNLALTFVEAGERVLLIDADLRRPKAWEYLDLPREVGLSNVLAGQVGLGEAVQTWGRDGGLVFLASGSTPPNPSELLGSPQMKALVDNVEGRFDRIIIDTSPVLPVTDAAVVSGYAKAVVLVIHHGKTSRTQVAHAVTALRNVDAKLVGTVLNMKKMTRAEREGYGAQTYYRSSAPVSSRSDHIASGVVEEGAEHVTTLRPHATHESADPDASGVPIVRRFGSSVKRR